MSYDFNVPYIDFVNEFDENDGADTFFDVNSQLGKLSINEAKNDENKNVIISENEEKEVQGRKSDLDESDVEKCLVETSVGSDVDKMSSSVVGEECKECKDIKSCSAEDICIPVKSEDEGARKISSKQSDILSEISDAAQNIKNNKKRKSVEAHPSSKFISLAEGVQKFQVCTPPRFHSQPKGKAAEMRKQSTYQKLMQQRVTIPQSPNLLSKARSRPVDYPTAEEREKKEMEEILSFKLEVHPLNPKILQTPKCGRRVAKQPIVVEPFNLTEFKRKEVRKNSSPFHFKAQAVPKGILEHVTGVPDKKPIPVTNPKTPQVLAKHKQRFQILEVVDGKTVLTSRDAHDTGVNCTRTSHSKTEPKPFSFEERDKIMMKHKEEMIQKVFQEEKEARKFHAKPLPNYLKKINKTLDSTVCSSKSTDNEEKKKPAFRAQPATVLHQEPFIPKRPERSILQPDPLTLATEERAKQRAQYDAAHRQYDEMIEAELQRRKELAEKQAREEEALLRKQTVHKAQPIRFYKAVPEKVKAPLTSPQSPCFTDRQQRHVKK